MGREIGSNKFTVPIDSVLLSKLNPRIPRVWMPVVEERHRAIASTEFIVLRPKSTDRRFLKHLLQSPSIRSELGARATGTTGSHQRVRVPDVLDIRVRVPPLPEQRKIAAILSSVDDAIEKTQAVIDQVRVVKRGLMQELLMRGLPGRHTRFKQTEIGEIPEEWELVRLGQIFKLTSGKGIAVRSLDENGSVENPYPVFGGNGIAGFTSCFNAEPPLLVVGRVGEYCGTVHRPVEPCWVSDNALYTRNWVRPVNVRFLGSLLQLIDLTRLRKKSGQPLVTQAPIHNLIVPLPSVPEQDEMADLLDQVDARLDAEQQKLDGLCNAKSALMSVLLTGEMRVTPDPKAA